jgi:PKD repeat protein
MKETADTKRRFTGRMAAIFIVLVIVLCALVPLVLALEGPVSTPPGGVTVVQSGDCYPTRPVTECIGRAGGTDFTFTDFDPEQYDVLYWGPQDANAVGLAFDCAVDEPGETMVLDVGASDFANGIARWTGTADITYYDFGLHQWVTQPFDTRFSLTTSDPGGPVVAFAGSDLGIGGTALITVPGDFEANMIMEVYFINSWDPALEVFDYLHTPANYEFCAISVVTDSFYFDDVPITGLSAINDSPTALGDMTALTATVDTGTNVTYTWDLGDGGSDIGAAVTHQYPTVGTYTATVTATNSAGFTTTTTLVTVDEAIAGLSATNDSPSELGETTNLTATITAGTNVTYAWDLGDGDSDVGAVVAHQYPGVGVYTATVTAMNSVGYTSTTTLVQVGDVAVSGLNAANDSPTALGATTTLTATIVTGTNVTYTWDLGDGQVRPGAVVGHMYEAIGTYTATVTATNTLGHAVATTLVTIDEPIVGLSATNDSPTKLGDTSTLTATITAGSNVSYTWALGDGSFGVGAVLTHVYEAIDTYTATVTATNSLGYATTTTLISVTSADYWVFLPLIK